MRKYVQKAFLICGYLLVIVVVSGFKAEELFDLREIFLVITGCLLLTVPYILEKKTKEELLEIAGNNSMLSSYMAAFVMVLGRRGQMEAGEAALQEILLCLRPVLYGFSIMVLLKRPEEKRAGQPELPVIQIQKSEAEHIEQEQEKQQLVPVGNMEEKETIESSCHSLGLTARETEIVKLVLGGLSNREIGEQLYIAESTVKKHMTNIFEKLGVKNREQLKQMFRE